MPRLIDAEKLFQDLREHNIPFNADINEAIIVAPTVDAEPVVRCKDCKHSYDAIGGTFCSYGTCVDCIVDVDFFCKNGERREDANSN